MKKEYFPFVYFFLKSNKVTSKLISAASGTSGSHQRVRPDDIFNSTFSLKNKDQIFDFHQRVGILLKKTFLNKEQIQTLENLRDTLLPKLMSGEVRVRYGQDN